MKRLIRRWLGLENAADVEFFRPIIQEIDKSLDGFREELQKFSEIECSHCGKLFKTYPYGGGYYRHSDGTTFCSAYCSVKGAK